VASNEQRKRVYDINGLSERINVPVTTIRRWRYEGRGPTAMKMGGHLRWDEDTVAAWEQELLAADQADQAARRAAV
jgi:predicted site-specific integrase-resolvase